MTVIFATLTAKIINATSQFLIHQHTDVQNRTTKQTNIMISPRLSSPRGFDLSKFVIDETSLLKKTELHPVLMSYLERRGALNLYTFCEHVEAMKGVKDGKLRTGLALQIYSDHIERGSVFEVNIASEDLKLIKRKLTPILRVVDLGELGSADQWFDLASDFYETEADIYNKCSELLLIELNYEIIPGFFRSQEFLSYAAKKPSLITSNLLEERPSLTVPELHSGTSIVTFDEFNFVSQLCKNSVNNWKLIFEVGDNCTMFKSTTRFNLTRDCPAKMFKITGIVPHSIDKVLRCLSEFSYRNKCDPSVTSYSDLDYIRSSKSARPSIDTECEPETPDDSIPYSHCISHEYIQFPMNKEWNSVLSNSLVHEEKVHRYILVQKTCTSDKDLVKPVNRVNMFRGWIVQKLSSQSTRYTQVLWTDAKGKRLKLFKNKIYAQYGMNLHKGLIETCPSVPESDVNTNEKCSILHCLKENSVYYSHSAYTQM